VHLDLKIKKKFRKPLSVSGHMQHLLSLISFQTMIPVIK